jgi:hypothetical protein
LSAGAETSAGTSSSLRGLRLNAMTVLVKIQTPPLTR